MPEPAEPGLIHGAAFSCGLEEFNGHRFFEAHESWETVWLGAPEPEKTFLQGLIQVAAAFHHFRRANAAGAKSLLSAGLEKLESFPGDYHGLELADLRGKLRSWAAALEKNSPAWELEFPKIVRGRAQP